MLWIQCNLWDDIIQEQLLLQHVWKPCRYQVYIHLYNTRNKYNCVILKFVLSYCILKMCISLLVTVVPPWGESLFIIICYR